MISNNQTPLNTEIASTVDENQTPIQEDRDPALNPQQNELFREVLKIAGTGILGSGLGYLAGSLTSYIVDLARNGLNEVQKRSEEDRAQLYFNSNIFSLSGLSIGLVAGISSYVLFKEILRQEQERSTELRAVQENLTENYERNFAGALSSHRIIDIHSNIKSEVSAQIEFGNGDVLRQHNPFTILVLGGGNQDEVPIYSTQTPPQNFSIDRQNSQVDLNQDFSVQDSDFLSAPSNNPAIRKFLTFSDYSQQEFRSKQSTQIGLELEQLKKLQLVSAKNHSRSI